jgi:hypothetical protein
MSAAGNELRPFTLQRGRPFLPSGIEIVGEPALLFINDFAAHPYKLSPFFVVDARPGLNTRHYPAQLLERPNALEIRT